MSWMLPGRLEYSILVLTLTENFFFQIFTPILHWIDGQSGPRPKPVPYSYGSRGPEEMDDFIAKYGFKRAETNG
jgi:hypothetical protein